jgi:hypothetical protein
VVRYRLEPRRSGSNNRRPTEPVPPDPTDYLPAKGCVRPPPCGPAPHSAEPRSADESAAQPGCAGTQRGGTGRTHPEPGCIQGSRAEEGMTSGDAGHGPGLEPGTSSLSAKYPEPLCGRSFSQVASDRRAEVMCSHILCQHLPTGSPALSRHPTRTRHLP